jgi:hypothetical protein
MRKKSDSSEMEKRINLIYAMLLQGLQRKTIIQYGTKEWSICDRQVDDYLSSARKLMSDDSQKDLEYKKSEILSQYYDLYNKSYALEDYKECKNVLQLISITLGVHTNKTDITSNGKEINSTPPTIIFLEDPQSDD